MVLISLSVALLSRGIDVTIPGSDSPVRKAILATMRPRVERELGIKVKFVVTSIRVDKGFAIVLAKPIHSSGKSIDFTKTRPKSWKKEDMEYFENMAGALLTKSKTGWKILEWQYGASDWAGEEWCKKHHAPKSILPVG